MAIDLDVTLVRDVPLHPAAAGLDIAARLRQRGRGLRIGLVNNMPDGALVATERQFAGLVEQATGGRVTVELYYLPGLPRGEEARKILDARYLPVSALYRNGIDALIVTGNEPRAARLDAEPYWSDMTQLIDWARDNTGTALWSCLAAHAAILHLDGIERRRLPAKRSGVYQSRTSSAGNLSQILTICHSRLNEAPRDALLAKGYAILSESGGGHVDSFSKRWASQFLFLQGHPEYDVESLAREYRRDVNRYLNGQRSDYPEMPENYFDSSAVRRFEEFRAHAEEARLPEMIQPFPAATLRQGLAARLAQSAASVFEYWMELVLA